ncbi:hypothetical protein SSP35_03_01010 [Streptomyces sp. NBRC 110611]|uniref:hypothetical protein n=1 Tax=Streptomyces sp. NBRC 110611 TaxID=1621259 RepID=UPI0008314CCF|nr:hypothetical protein [Streptomyces sp. NBRC 110611]GAU66453.1 hypothetical protein SSP35_03_01010 [Streptomyces sp. NBRC 110611]
MSQAVPTPSAPQGITASAITRVHKTSRRKSSVMAGGLATAFLTGISLIGYQTPAFADDGQPAKIADGTYESDQGVIAAMEKTDPVNSSESSMGYPAGVDKDKDGNVKPFTLADVQSTYDPEQAVKDAQAAATQYAADEKHSAPLRESAKHLVDGWSDTTKPNGTEIRQNTKDNVLTGGQSAEQYCNMSNKDPQSSAYGQAAPCMFVGKLDEKYPQRGASDGLTGEGKLTYKVSASVADESSTTEGWQVGGKITPKIGDGESEVGGEASFTYSYSSTSTTKVQNTKETDVEINVPQGKKGYLEGRANGATYTGYIVVRDLDTSTNQEHVVAIPARVFIQAPGSGSSVTWVKRLKAA